jgi:hypothetical protein
MLEQKSNLRSRGILRYASQGKTLRADRPFKKKIIRCEARDVVAKATALESIGISFQNPLALAMGEVQTVPVEQQAS